MNPRGSFYAYFVLDPGSPLTKDRRMAGVEVSLYGERRDVGLEDGKERETINSTVNYQTKESPGVSSCEF